MVKTESSLNARAERGSKQKFQAALAKIKDTEPDPIDRL